MILRTAQLILLGLGLVVLEGCGTASDRPADTAEAPLFAKLKAEKTKVTFENALSEKPTPHRTELLYEYFSNGAGVAIGDVNGDGRDDLYFTGNMRYNALYLNQGDLTFRDVTASAGVRGRKNTWNTGVSMADVNGDGRLDLYVCYSGELPLDRRVDELYINQGPDEEGTPQFNERAAAFGLAQPHSSNQAYFFDYDRDGDLDLYLQTHNVQTIPRGTRRSARKRLAAEDSVNGNRFYENQGGTFVDVTEQAGIQSSPLTYGLGAGVADLNKDGWPDIYVGNDYSPPDYLYINNGDGTFSNTIRRSMGHISRASMGVDASDVNNDGRSDVYVLDMIAEGNRRQKLLHIPNDRRTFEKNVASGFHHQYTVNTLQLNNGNGTFSEIGQLAGVSNTDWSWAPLFADYNNDGWKDLYVTNGILHDITNRDFIRLRRQYLKRQNYDLKPKDVAALMEKMPSKELENYAFKNEGGQRFTEVSSDWGLAEAVNSNGAAYGDLDGDGDLDLVANNINEKASVYENRSTQLTDHHFLRVHLAGTGKNTDGIGAKVSVWTGRTRQYLEQFPARGYLSSVSPTLHFGLGEQRRIDSLRVVWPDGRAQTRTDVQADQTLTLRQAGASGRSGPETTSDSALFRRTASPFDFRHRMEGRVDDFRRQPLLVNAKSFAGPALASADVNGDERADVFVGGGNGQAGRVYVQTSEGTFARRPQPAFEADRAANDVEARFVDVTGDEHPDLYVGAGGYGAVSENDPALQDRLYVNDGTGTFSAAREALPRMRTSTGTVAPADINGDGHPDLFVGGRVRPGRYPESPRSYVLINNGEGRFTDRTAEVAPALKTPGMVTDALWHDLDGDGASALVVLGEWMPIRVFERDGTMLTERTEAYFGTPRRGLWYGLNVFSLRDGRVALLAGNLGRNSQLHASRNRPLELFYDDFDANGRIDPILSYYLGENRYPHVLLDRLAEAVPPLAARFPDYEAYADATLSDLLTASERKAADRLRASQLHTSLFLMGEDGSFTRQALPVQAQYAPVFGADSLDYNRDGHPDLLLTGNMNETRVRFAKYDANYGVLLRGNGEGKFTYVPQRTSGFALTGDVRGTVRVGSQLLFGVNRDSVVAYRPVSAEGKNASIRAALGQ